MSCQEMTLETLGRTSGHIPASAEQMSVSGRGCPLSHCHRPPRKYICVCVWGGGYTSRCLCLLCMNPSNPGPSLEKGCCGKYETWSIQKAGEWVLTELSINPSPPQTHTITPPTPPHPTYREREREREGYHLSIHPMYHLSNLLLSTIFHSYQLCYQISWEE